MAYYWVKIKDFDRGIRGGGTVQATSDVEARSIVEGQGVAPDRVVSVLPLPYPASPYINAVGCPDFCYLPDACSQAGRCTASRSCVE